MDLSNVCRMCIIVVFGDFLFFVGLLMFVDVVVNGDEMICVEVICWMIFY